MTSKIWTTATLWVKNALSIKIKISINQFIYVLEIDTWTYIYTVEIHYGMVIIITIYTFIL